MYSNTTKRNIDATAYTFVLCVRHHTKVIKLALQLEQAAQAREYFVRLLIFQADIMRPGTSESCLGLDTLKDGGVEERSRTEGGRKGERVLRSLQTNKGHGIF